MSYRRFALYNVVGGTAWILIFLLAGWWFGGREVVQKNFKLVIVAIIVISVLPGVFEYVKARRKPKAVNKSSVSQMLSESTTRSVEDGIPTQSVGTS